MFRYHIISDYECSDLLLRVCGPKAGFKLKFLWFQNPCFSPITPPLLWCTPVEVYCLFQSMSEFGMSVDANELNLFTHSKLALVYFECKMSTGIFNVWNLSSVFTPIFAQTSPPPLRIYCGFDLCCLKPLKSFQRSRAVFFFFFLPFLFFLPQYTGTRSGHGLLFSLIKALYTSVTSWSYW